MTRAEHIRALMDEYAQQRAANDDALEARIAVHRSWSRISPGCGRRAQALP